MDDTTTDNGSELADDSELELSDEMIDKVVGGFNAYHGSIICDNCGRSISSRFARTIVNNGNTLRVCSSCAGTLNRG